MSILSLGDVVTVEPPLGVVLRDEDGGLWKHLPGGWCYYRADGRRHERLIGLSWDAVYCARPLVVAELPGDKERLISELDDARVTIRALVEPKPAPAEDWEIVTAEQVKVGDEVEVTRRWDGGRGVVTGRVSEIDRAHQWALRLDGWGWVEYRRLRTDVERTTIRRRVRTPMAELEGPAVVKHAGCVFARVQSDETQGRWLCLGPRQPGAYWWHTWPEVLALDPTTDPVVVDLGTTTNPTSERSPS